MPYARSETALLLIDIQKGIEHYSDCGTTRSTPNFAENVKLLLSSFRKVGSPVYHVCHHSTAKTSSLHPSKDTCNFTDYATPLSSEPVFPKSTNSAFIGTTLEAAIREQNIKRLVVVGLTTAHCVSTTMRMASNLQVVRHESGSSSIPDSSRGALVVVSDATATFDATYNGRLFDAETVQAVNLAALKDEFCDVETTVEVLKQLEHD